MTEDLLALASRLSKGEHERAAFARACVFAVLVALALTTSACAHLAADACVRDDLHGCPIEEVAVVGNHVIDAEDITSEIATAETSRALLGLVVVEYELFDRFVLERDLARVERTYRARGFYEARARAARVIRLSGERVRVEIVVDEGLPVAIGKVELVWKDWRLEPTTINLTASVAEVRDRLKIGARFDETAYNDVKRAIVRAMTDRGFAYGSVSGQVDVDLAAHTASITFSLEMGPHCTFGDILIEGLGELPESSVRAAIDIDKGDTFSTSTLEAAEYALADYGVFGSIEIEPKLSPKGEPRNTEIPVRFMLPPASLRQVKAGIGAEVGSRLEAHLVGGWESRNFLGGLRRLAVEARPGIELYPASVSDFSALSDPTPLYEVRSRFEFKQPQAIEARTNAIVRAAVNVYHLQQDSSQDTIDQCFKKTDDGGASGTADCTIVGYSEYVGTVGLERLFAKSRLYLGQFAHWQIDDPFAYYNSGTLPRGFEVVTIRHLETVAWFDYRMNSDGKRDAVRPNKGVYLGANVQFAGSFLGGDADDLRLRPEFRGYAPISKHVTLGFRLTGGLLFTRNYGDSLDQDKPPEQRTAEEEQAFTRDMQLLSFRAFFSGGPYSNRGYGTNTLGPRATVLDTTDNRKRIVSGGRTLWESSLELRFPLVSDLGGAVFVDASDVTRDLGELRLTHPHISAGIGLRYETPVGPLRADVGYRVPCLQVAGDCNDLPADPTATEIDAAPGVSDEGAPGDIFGAPIAISIVFGEAF